MLHKRRIIYIHSQYEHINSYACIAYNMYNRKICHLASSSSTVKRHTQALVCSYIHTYALHMQWIFSLYQIERIPPLSMHVRWIHCECMLMRVWMISDTFLYAYAHISNIYYIMIIHEWAINEYINSIPYVIRTIEIKKKKLRKYIWRCHIYSYYSRKYYIFSRRGCIFFEIV